MGDFRDTKFFPRHPSDSEVVSQENRSTGNEGTSPVRRLLERALQSSAGLDDIVEPDRARLRSLMGRLDEGRFQLAVLGQFKRGKSTPLNALLGEALLPTSAISVTSVPTFVRWGPEKRVHIVYLPGQPSVEETSAEGKNLGAFLAKFVTEEGNPKNVLGVSSVEVLHPAPILARGAVLIDTPGIGSTYRHNTETTLNFLPESFFCFAGLLDERLAQTAEATEGAIGVAICRRKGVAGHAVGELSGLQKALAELAEIQDLLERR